MTLHAFRLILSHLFAILALAGCVATTPLQQSPGLPAESPKLTMVTVRFLEDDHRTEVRALPVRDFRILFGWIGGALFGSRTSDSFLEPSISGDYQFTLDFHALDETVQRESTQVTTQIGNPVIEPRATKLARVGTFTMDPSLRRLVGSTTWIDGETNELLILIYFDRACTIRDRLFEDGREYRFDVAIPRAGFSWLRYRQVDERVTDIVLTAMPSLLQLSVTPVKISP